MPGNKKILLEARKMSLLTPVVQGYRIYDQEKIKIKKDKKRKIPNNDEELMNQRLEVNIWGKNLIVTSPRCIKPPKKNDELSPALRTN